MWPSKFIKVAQLINVKYSTLQIDISVDLTLEARFSPGTVLAEVDADPHGGP